MNRIPKLIVGFFTLALCSQYALAQSEGKLFRWVDENGVVHFGDSIPAEYSEIERQVVNEHGITVDVMRAKKTEAEKAEELRLQELEEQEELRRRADQALLATYLSVDEIIMHRDRRVELFQAQTRITELYLRNLTRRLDSLKKEASTYKPYSEDPDAPMIDQDLADDMALTRNAIKRYEENLANYQSEEQIIITSFNDDVERFKELKGLN